MRGGLRRKVNALGVIQVVTMAGVMALLGILFFQKMLGDTETFTEGAAEVKTREAEGLAKLMALEIGRLDSLRYARAMPREDVIGEIRAVLWEKVTFIAVLEELDLIARVPSKTVDQAVCLRPMGTDTGCAGIPGLAGLVARMDDVDRMERVSEGVYVTPLYVAGSFWGLIRMKVSNSTVQYTLQQLAHKNRRDLVSAVALFGGCLVGAAVLLFLVLSSFFKRMHGPLVALTDQAVAFGRNPDLPPQPIDADAEDEIGVLATRFFEMQGALQESRQREHLTRLGELAARLGHEIGNQLNAMKFAVRGVRRALDKGKAVDPERVQVLSESIDVCDGIVQKLRAQAAGGEEPQRPMADVRAADLLKKVRTKHRDQLEHEGITLALVREDAPLIRGNAEELARVLTNMVYNARDAVREKGDPGRIEVACGTDAAGRCAVRITDDGVGMADDVRARIFEAGFTTKKLATGSARLGGSGLGLHESHLILERHGVSTAVSSTPGEGTEIVMTFPPSGEE